MRSLLRLFVCFVCFVVTLWPATAPAPLPPWSPRIVTLVSGALVRITRIDATDIAFDRVSRDGADAQGQPVYRVLAPAQAVPPLPDFAPATATAWPSDATLSAHIATELAKPAPVAAHRVLKDTIIQRIKAAGKLPALAQLIAALPAEQQFEFNQSAWFSSANPLILAGCQQLALDPAAILAPDPLAP